MVTINSANEPTAASGKVLQGQGIGTASAFSTATYPATATGTGTILRADGTNWVASTPTYPNAASTAGKVVVSDGTNLIMSTPTFPNASATSRKIIVSDGTNWTASTETWAVPGTSGNVLTSDGTNWTSATPTGLITIKVSLTNSQLKAINSTPITVVAAQGANTVVAPVWFTVKFVYGGNNAFTGSNALFLAWTNASGTKATSTLLSSVAMTGTATVYNTGPFTTTNTAADGAINNQLICISAAANYAGNAANDNTVIVTIAYYIATLT